MQILVAERKRKAFGICAVAVQRGICPTFLIGRPEKTTFAEGFVKQASKACTGDTVAILSHTSCIRSKSARSVHTEKRASKMHIPIHVHIQYINTKND